MQEPAPAPDGQVADAVKDNWVDTWAPAAVRPYLRLSRADRPIGTWLLLIPCWWGLVLSMLHDGRTGLNDLWIAVGCAVGAWLMRGAGCTWNDITDRNFDGAVERTRSRPIPSGQVTLRAAVIWMCAQSLLAFAILLTFNTAAIALGVLALLPVAVYPFAKRFTWWPQVFLGLAFNWGALIGIKSTARLFGNKTPAWLRRFLMLTVGLMGLAVIFTLLPAGNVFAMVIALAGPWAMGWHMAWQLRGLDTENSAKLLQLFRSNRDTGLIPLIFFVVALFV